MRRFAIIVPALSLLAVLTAACGSAERSAQPDFTRTDSAGGVVAVNATPAGDLRPVLTVVPEPRVRIGVEEGTEELQFTNIESMVRLPDGRIAVANGQPMEIRIFSESGTFVTTHGRQGQGPGEFQYLSRLLSGGGDTLLAVNDPQFQLLRFTAGGGYVGMTVASRDSIQRQLGAMHLAEGVHEYFRDGSVVIAARLPSGERIDGDQYRTGELFRPTTTLVWIARDYARSQVIGEFGEIQQMFIDIGGGRREPVIPPSARFRRSALGGIGDRFCVAGNETAEIRCLDQDGSRLVIRWNQDSVPTTQAAIDEWRQAARARAARPGAHTTPQATEKIIAAVIIPSTLPPVLSLIVDAERRILVAGPDLTSDTEGWRRYRVFSADGELLGVADLPAVRIYEVGADYLLGVSRNADGVEFVVIHDVARSLPSRAELRVR